MISADLVGCATARNKGTCANRVNIRRDRLEARVLNALRHRLMDPALFAVFCKAFTGEVNRARIDARTSLDAARREIERTDREIQELLQPIVDGHGDGRAVNARMKELGARQDELRSFLAEAEEPPTLLHPEMATGYRRQAAELHAALKQESEAKHLKAAEVLRSLIDRMVRTPEGGELEIDVVGDLAGLLALAANKDAPLDDSDAWLQQDKMVAGAGFEPATFRL